MSTKKFSACRMFWLSAIVWLGLLGSGGVGQEPVITPEVHKSIRDLNELYTTGKKSLIDSITRLGFNEEFKSIVELDGTPVNSLSSEDVLFQMVRSAEATRRGMGDEFIALLYKDAAKRSAALQTTGEFERYRTILKDKPDLAPASIKFTRPATSSESSLEKAPEVVKKVVPLLAEQYRGAGLGRARGILLKHLTNPRLTGAAYNRVIMNSKSSEEALHELFRLGTNPPPAEEAARKTLKEAKEHSAALAMDPRTKKIMDELSGKQLSEAEQRYAKTASVPDSLAKKISNASDVENSRQRIEELAVKSR